MHPSTTTNRGCGYSWNQGVCACQATWTLLLNNDVLHSRLRPPGRCLRLAQPEKTSVIQHPTPNERWELDVECFILFSSRQPRARKL